MLACAVLCGCGSSSSEPAARPTVAGRVVSGSCSASASASAPSEVSACVLITGAGQRFRCPRYLPGTTAATLAHRTGCVQLSPLALSAATRAAIQKIEGARDCLTGKGWRVTGGPVLPAPTANVPAADGELIVGSGRRGAFIVFSRDAEAAARRANAINRDALRIGGELQRRGPVTILWAHSPTSEQRSTLDACLPTA